MREIYECKWCYGHFGDRAECAEHEPRCHDNPESRSCETCDHHDTVVADTGKVWNTCAVGLLTSPRWVENHATGCQQWSRESTPNAPVRRGTPSPQVDCSQAQCACRDPRTVYNGTRKQWICDDCGKPANRKNAPDTAVCDCLPCPFCGAMPKLSLGKIAPGWFQVECIAEADKCGVYLYTVGQTEAEATARWNRRVNTAELLDALEAMARKHCATVYHDGRVSCLHADAMRLLANHGRFRITFDFDMENNVVGYWPENDPEKGGGK